MVSQRKRVEGSMRLYRWYRIGVMFFLLVWRPCLSGVGRLSLGTAWQVAVILAPTIDTYR